MYGSRDIENNLNPRWKITVIIQTDLISLKEVILAH